MKKATFRNRGLSQSLPAVAGQRKASLGRWTVPYFLIAVLLVNGCNQMYEQDSVRLYEEPQMHPPEGAVAADIEEMKTPSAEEMTGMVEAGRLAYRRYCWPCHGPNMDGKGTVGSSFPKDFASLTDDDVVELEDDELFEIIGIRVNMHPPMASTLTPEERWQVVAFIRAVQKGWVKPGSPWEEENNR